MILINKKAGLFKSYTIFKVCLELLYKLLKDNYYLNHLTRIRLKNNHLTS